MNDFKLTQYTKSIIFKIAKSQDMSVQSAFLDNCHF